MLPQTFTTLCAAIFGAVSGAQDGELRIVPQFPRLWPQPQTATEDGSAPVMRVGGYGRSVLQVITPPAGYVARLVTFPEQIEGAARIGETIWVSSESGIFRQAGDGREPELVLPGWSGRLLAGPEGLLGFLGRVQVPGGQTGRLVGLARLAVIDEQLGESIVSTELLWHHDGDMAWIDGKLHGACSGGRGFLSASQSGPIEWKHVALDPSGGTVVTLDSYAGPRRSNDPAKPVPSPPSWRDSRARAIGRLPANHWGWLQPALVARRDRLDHVFGSQDGVTWCLRLEDDGSVALVHLDRPEAPRWRMGRARRPARSASFHPNHQDRARWPLVRLLAGATLGVGEVSAWDLHAGVAAIAAYASDSNEVHVSSLIGGKAPRTFKVPDLPPGPQGADLPGVGLLGVGLLGVGSSDWVQGIAWNRAGSRVLVCGGSAMAELDIERGAWSPVHQFPKLHREAIAVPGGWWVSGVWGTCWARRGPLGTWDCTPIDVGDSIAAVVVAPDGAHLAAVDSLGHCALVDAASGSVTARWMSLRPGKGRGQPGCFLGGGRFFLYGTALPGHVRVLDLKTGATFLEWQTVFDEGPIPEWLIWTPSGAFLGSSTARRAFLRIGSSGKPVALPSSSRGRAEIVRRIRRLLRER